MSDPAEKDVETQAREMGWVSPDDWVGDAPPNGFMDAETFVERGQKVLPIVQSENRKLQEKLDKAMSEVEEIKATAEKFKDFNQKALQREREEKRELIAKLEQERADAISDGDGEAAVQAEKEIKRLENETPAQQDPDIEAKIGRWLEENTWFNENPNLRMWADGKALELSQKGVAPGIPTLEIIAKEVKQAWPELFTDDDAPTPKPGAIDGGGHRRSNGGSRSWDDLPAEAKKAYSDFKDLMPEYTKKEYLDTYEWEE